MDARSERADSLIGAAHVAALAALRGCAQLAFCRTARSGAMILAGIALLAPACALGTAAGVAFGTAAGRTLGYDEEAWRAGLAGFNPGLVGLTWGGLLASGEPHWSIFALALAACMALDVVARRIALRARMPSLTTAALVTLYAVGLGAAPDGGWFLVEPTIDPVTPYGAAGAGFIGFAMAAESRFAAAWTLLLAAAAVAIVVIAGYDLHATFGLWGIAVPLAAYGVAAVFLRGSLPGALAAAIAACAAAATWAAWHATGLSDVLPPIVAPFIVGTWVGLVAIRGLAARSPLASPFSRLARQLVLAHVSGRPVIVVLAEGGSGAEIHAHGRHALRSLDTDALIASARARATLWEAIASARDLARDEPDLLREPLATLVAGEIVSAVIRPSAIEHEEGPRTIALRGRLDRTECLGCGIQSHWPPLALWRRMDLRCPACNGPVIPDRAALGLALSPSVLDRLNAICAHRALVLVAVEAMDDALVRTAVEHLRAGGAILAFIGRARPATIRAHDLRVTEPLVPTLERLSRLLVILRRAGRLVGWPRREDARVGQAAPSRAAHHGPE